MTDLIRNAPAKPRKGTALLAKRKARKDWKAAEDAVMRQARKRDHGVCRRPRCPFKSQNLPIDVCHRRDSHRGSGGDRGLTRTTVENLIALCRGCHGLYDGFLLDIDPFDAKDGFSGPCSWSVREGQTGKMEHIATERIIGVSTVRG
jgi:hypothetical protein